MEHAHTPVKTKLMVILPIALVYILLNYIPFEHFFQEELYYLIFRLSTYLVTAGVAYYLVKKFHVHCYCPLKELNKLWLIPLLLPCITNFSYVLIADVEAARELEPLILALDLISDFFGSVIEDCIFIEAVISIFIDVWPKKGKFEEIKYALITALIFTAIHCYSFIYDDWGVALYKIGVTFLLTLECSYLAIYYDQAWVPLIVHFLYNATNLVTFNHFYPLDKTMNVAFVVFTLLTIAFAICYCLALYKISILQDPREEQLEETHEKE